MKKFLVVLLVLALMLSSVSAMAAKSTDDAFKIIMTCSNTAGKPHTDAVIEALTRIEERTNGHVLIEFHGGNEMFTGAEGVEAVMSDSAVMYLTDASTFADYCPAYATLTAPFLMSDYEQAEAFLATEFWQGIEAEAAQAGVYSVINDLVLGTRNILASVPVNSIEDCAKLNIRVPDNTLYISIFDALGANYLAMSTSDMVNAMQTGMCNAMEGTAATVKSYVQSLDNPCYTLDGHLMNIVGIHCGTGYWNTIPEEYQQIITEELEKAAYDSNRLYAANFETDLAALEAAGVQVIRLSDEVMADFVSACSGVAEAMPRYSEFKAAIDGL